MGEIVCVARRHVDGSLDTPSSVASDHLRAGAEAYFVEDPVDSVGLYMAYWPVVLAKRAFRL